MNVTIMQVLCISQDLSMNSIVWDSNKYTYKGCGLSFFGFPRWTYLLVFDFEFRVNKFNETV